MCVKNAFVAQRDPNPPLERKTMTGAFLLHLELLRRRSHIQLMRPQTRLAEVVPLVWKQHLRSFEYFLWRVFVGHVVGL